MNLPYPHAPSGEPFSWNLDPSGSKRPGILFVHGFTAAPTEMRPLADHLRTRHPDWPMVGVRLSGHGGSGAEFEQAVADPRVHERWLQDCAEGLSLLRPYADKVALVGLSMGAGLCCRLAQRELTRGDGQIRGLILLAPVFGLGKLKHLLIRLVTPVKRHFAKSSQQMAYYHKHGLNSQSIYPLKGLNALKRSGDEAWLSLRQLGSAGIDSLIIGGQKDDLTPTAKLARKRALLGGELHWLASSGHILTVEPDRAELFSVCERFLDDRVFPVAGHRHG